MHFSERLQHFHYLLPSATIFNIVRKAHLSSNIKLKVILNSPTIIHFIGDVRHPDRNVRGEDHGPEDEDGGLGEGDCSVGEAGHREHHRQEPVCRHHDQGVDGDVGGDVDDVLNSATPGQTKGPVHENIVTGGGGDTDQDEEDICHRQVENQKISRVLHLRITIHLRCFKMFKAFKNHNVFLPQ